MEKEVKPNPIPKPPLATPVKKPIPKIQRPNSTTIQRVPVPQARKVSSKKIKYKYAGKEKLSEILGKSIPKQLIPTKRFGEIFGYVFLAVLIIAALTFPYGSLISGKADMALKIGVPFTFLELDASNAERSPIKFTGLILDLIIYAILSYAIDVIMSLAIKNPILRSKEDRKKHPQIFKNKKAPTIADQLAKKIIQKTQTPPAPKPPVPKKSTITMYNPKTIPSSPASPKQPSQRPTS